MELIKSKKNIICCIVIFIEFIFIEFPYYFLVGPVGVFGGSEIMIKIINAYGRMIKIVPIDKDMLMEVFTQRIGSCDVPCAQLARLYADNWGIVLLVCLPVLTNVYINKKIKRTDTMVDVFRLFALLTLYILAVIILLSAIPLVCMVKLSTLYEGGPTMELFMYIGLWLVPSIMVLTGLEILLAFVVQEPIGQFMAYVLLIAPSLPPDVSGYPFYKLVIRFNGKSENFYYEMRREMLLNRGCVIAAAMIIFFIISVVLKGRKKVIR